MAPVKHTQVVGNGPEGKCRAGSDAGGMMRVIGI